MDINDDMSEFFQCSICMEPFDEIKKVPRLLQCKLFQFLNIVETRMIIFKLFLFFFKVNIAFVITVLINSTKIKHQHNIHFTVQHVVKFMFKIF